MYGLFNIRAFTVVSVYTIVNKSFYCVIGFDIIQDHILQLWSLNIYISRYYMQTGLVEK